MLLTLFRERDFPKLILPSLLAVVLFVLAVFVIILPGFKESLLERKKETIQELTTTTWDILHYYSQKKHRENCHRKKARHLQLIRLKICDMVLRIKIISGSMTCSPGWLCILIFLNLMERFLPTTLIRKANISLLPLSILSKIW